MVPISAVGMAAIWAEKCWRSSSLVDWASLAVKPFSKRSFSSPAALTVKVEMKSWLTLMPRLIISKIRSTMTKVLPEPADADTRMLVPLL